MATVLDLSYRSSLNQTYQLIRIKVHTLTQYVKTMFWQCDHTQNILCTHTRTHTRTGYMYTQVFQEPVLNGFILLGKPAWSEARQVMLKLLSKDEVSVIEAD